MNKGKKIISTLAIASMLAGNVLPLTSLAATAGVESGVYTVGTNKYVSFRVKTDSKDTKVTVADVAEKLGKTVTNITDTTTPVGTGTTITTADGDYTVVLYGDIDGNGLVEMTDASAIAKHVVGLETLSGAKLEAANVGAHNGVDMADASTVAKYVIGSVDYTVETLPTDPEQEVQETNYVVTLNEKYVNNQNENAVKGMLTVTSQLEEKLENIYFYAVKADGTIETTALAGPYTLEAYTSKIPVSIDTTKYTDMPDGVNTIKVIAAGTKGANYETGEVLSTFTIEKHTEEVDKAKIVGIKGARPASTGNNAGSVSFNIQSDVKIVKAYYKTETFNSSKPSVANFKENGSYSGVINVTDNKVTDAPVKLDVSDQAYDVYFILEDEYGSISKHLCNSSDDNTNVVKATIPSATYTKNAKTVTKVEMPNLENETSTSSAKITITTSENMTTSDKFQAVLYKDSKTIAEKEITGSSSGKTVQIALSSFTPTVKDAGEYYVEVFGKGNNTIAPSETTKSNTVNVSPIASVSSVEYIRYMENGTEYDKLSWKTPHNKLDVSSPGYEVYVSDYDQTAKAYKDFAKESKITDSQVIDSDDTTVVKIVNPTNIIENTLYKAQVIALAKSGHKLSEANSLPTVSKEFFKLETPEVVTNSATSSEAALELTSISSTSKKDNTISGKTPTYSVEVYTLNPNYKTGSMTEAKYIRASQYDQAVEVNKSSGRFSVKGLTGGTEYAIKLVATVQGLNGTVKGESKFVDLGTKKAMFNIDNKEVTTNADTRNGKIRVNGSVVSIDGVDYNVSDYVELAKVTEIVKVLKDNDHITYSTTTPNEVSISISTTDNSAKARKLPASAKDMIVNITGNSYNQTLESTEDNDPAQINIKGTPGGVIDIQNLKAKNNRIVITDATVKVGSTKNVVVAEGSTVTFANTANFYTVKASKETPVKVGDKALTVTKTTVNATSDLEVKNFAKDLTLTVDGTGTLNGNITLNGKGNVKVTPTVSVASTINVTTIDGAVDLLDEKLTGHQSVTVSYTVSPTTRAKNDTVKAFASVVAPFNMNKLKIKQYDYNDETDKQALIEAIGDVKVMTDKGTSSSSPVEDVDATKANFKLVNDYLAKFGLTGTDNNGKSIAKYDATITVNKNQSLVTITFAKDTKDNKGVVQQVKIEGLR